MREMSDRPEIAKLRELSLELDDQWRRIIEVSERAEILIDSPDDAIITANLEGEIVSWNPAATRLFGWTEDEVLGSPLAGIIPERFRSRHLEGMERYKATGTSTVIGKPYRLPALHRDGYEFMVEMLVSGYQTGVGRFVSARVRRAGADEAG